MLLHEDIDEELFDLAHMGDDFLVAAVLVGADRGEFEAVERALAGQGFATIAPRARGLRRAGSVLPTSTASSGSSRSWSWSLRSS